MPWFLLKWAVVALAGALWRKLLRLIPTRRERAQAAAIAKKDEQLHVEMDTRPADLARRLRDGTF